MSRKNKRPARQPISRRWWIAGGVILAAAAGIWLLVSIRGSANEPRPISRLSTADYHSLVFSPTEPETVFFGHHNGLMISRDGGQSWEVSSLQNADAMAVAAPAADPQILYAAGHNVFFKSTDAGESWQSVANDLPGLDIHGFVVDPQDANSVYAHVVGFATLYHSDDGGSTWSAMSGPMQTSTFSLAFGSPGQTLYAAAGNAGLWRTDDGGQSWTQMPGTPGEAVVALAFNTPNQQLLISVFGKGADVYAFDADNATWTPLGLKRNVMAIAASPHDPQHLIVVDEKGSVFASRDGGATWSDK